MSRMTRMVRLLTISMLSGLLAWGAMGGALAQNAKPDAPKSGVGGSATTGQPAARPVEGGKPVVPPAASPKDKAADDVLNELLKKRADSPLIEGTRNEAVAKPGETAVKPGGKLRREGQFIVTRRARMVATNSGIAQWMVTFEGDKDGMQDPPMYLMPCQMLEDMERTVKQNGDSVVFIISGQIFVYKSNNYLLPTLSVVAPKRGNLGQ